ncbi:MAG: PorP/SprF family type IX secretion system membrane protein [Bacteroidales bacterium]|nr:PorP/SprF family type IX secretion system membrane protein [Bacteroidales bacterium]
MRLKLYIILFISNLILVEATGQIVGQYTQWSRYLMSQNVAYAGYTDYLTAGLLHRQQWVGFNGAPVTQLLEIQSALRKPSFGMGLVYNHENIHRHSNHSALLSYAYRINSRKFTTAFGLGVGVGTSKINTYFLQDEVDDSFGKENQARLNPIASFGLAFYNRRFHLGLSIPELMSSESSQIKVDFNNYMLKLTGGYKFNVSSGIQLEPTLLVASSISNGTHAAIDLKANIKDALLAGVGVRTSDAMYLLLGYVVNKQISVAYSYDYNIIGALESNTSGSHEIGIVYHLNYVVNTADPRDF